MANNEDALFAPPSQEELDLFAPPSESELAMPAGDELPLDEELPEEEQGPSKTEALLRGGGQGLTAGFQDELSAALSALLPPTEVDKITGKGGYLSGMTDRYRSARDTFRKDNAESQEAHPYVYGAGEIGGGILSTPLIPGGAGAQGATKLARIAKGVKEGVKYGSVAGLGYSDAELTPDKVSVDSALQAGKDTIKGGAIGGAFGGVATTAVEGGKAVLGALKNTKAARQFGQGKAIGETGESLMGENNRIRIEGERADQAQRVAQGIEALQGKVSEPAAAKISKAVDGSLEQVGKDLGLQKQELFDFIQTQHDEVGRKIEQTYANAEANGVKINAKELLSTIRDELQNTVFNSKVDEAQKARILKNLESYLLKEKMPMKFQTTKVEAPGGGEPISESSKLGGKNLSLEEVQAMKAQQEAGTLGDVAADSASIESRKNPVFGEATVSKEAQTITPPAEELGPLSPKEALQARNYLGDEAAGLSGKPQTVLAGGRKKLSDLISEQVGGDIKASNEKYTTIKRIFDEMGEPIPEYVGPGELPPKGLNKLVERMGKAKTEGDKVEAARLFEALKTLDPTKASQMEAQLGKLSTQENALKGTLNQQPEAQLSVLKEQGLLTPEIEAAGKQVQDVASLTKKVGTQEEIQKARRLVDDLSSNDVAKSRDAEALVKEIEQFDPSLAEELRTKGKDISTKFQLVSELSQSMPTEQSGIVKRLVGAISKIPAKAGNIYGLSKNAITKEIGPVANPLTNLSNLIQKSPGQLESIGFAPKYADRLREASKRGKSAIAATNFILSQFPDYRETMEKYQDENGARQEVENTLGEPGNVSPNLTEEANSGMIKADESKGSMPIGEPSMKPEEQTMDLSPGAEITPTTAKPKSPEKEKLMQIVQVGASRLLQNPEISKSTQVKSLIARALNEKAGEFQNMDQNEFLLETMARVDTLIDQLGQFQGGSPEDQAAAAAALKNLKLFRQSAESKIAQ